jgi:putative SOS response-associated peptidase YedK
VCGRYVQARTTPLLADTFVAEVGGDGPAVPSWNVAPTDRVPVVLARAGRELRLLQWGLVPSWAKDPAIGSRLINARAETLGEKPSFRQALSRRRCLVPADGWYEWMVLAPAADGRVRKQPYYHRADGAGQLAFAGLYEHWRAQPGQPWLSTFTIITTTATDELGRVHDRSPVLLDEADWELWLDPGITDAPVELLRAAGPGLVRARPVSTRVNSVRNDGPELVAELPPETTGDQLGASLL